jgi:hypothetical protein
LIRKNRFAWLVLLFVSAPSLAKNAPPPDERKNYSFQDLLQQAAGSASDAPAVAGVRGLEETSGVVDTKARDFAAIERLEHLVVHEAELKKFIEEGKLR